MFNKEYLQETLAEHKAGNLSLNPLRYIGFGVVASWVKDMAKFLCGQGSFLVAGFGALGLGGLIFSVKRSICQSQRGSEAKGEKGLLKTLKAGWQGFFTLCKEANTFTDCNILGDINSQGASALPVKHHALKKRAFLPCRHLAPKLFQPSTRFYETKPF